MPNIHVDNANTKRAHRAPECRCGITNHKGTHDSLDDAAAKETAAEAAARLAVESKETKASIL
jgi:hypothetical protein